MEMYEVGGCVRDELLGMKPKDIDFTVVLSEDENLIMTMDDGRKVFADPYIYMVDTLEEMGIGIFRNPKTDVPVGAEYLTARGISPKRFPRYPGRALDFVLARKESDYTDGRRPDTVEVGSLMDDLRRRDFTMNAIAKDADGNLIDPFLGASDIEDRVIRAVGSAHERFEEDALRMLRAVRFKVTKGFMLHHDIMQALDNPDLLERLASVSDERKREELNRMFAYDTVASLQVLDLFKDLRTVLFSGRLSLTATMKERKR